MQKTFIGFRHLESCNNLKDQKGGAGLDKDLDPGASMWGVLQGLCISAQNEGLLVEGEKMGVDVHVSCLVRTWMTAILIYLPLLSSGGTLHLKISPFLKETDQGEKARDMLDKKTLDTGYKIIGINTGLKRLDLGNMPENRISQLSKIKRFLKTLFQMGNVLADKPGNEWIVDKINKMKGKKINIELVYGKNTTYKSVEIYIPEKPLTDKPVDIPNEIPQEITFNVSGIPEFNTFIKTYYDSYDNYRKNFETYVTRIAGLFNKQIFTPVVQNTTQAGGEQPFSNKSIQHSNKSIQHSNSDVVAKQPDVKNRQVNLTGETITGYFPNQKMKTEGSEFTTKQYSDSVLEYIKEFLNMDDKNLKAIGNYEPDHFKSDVGAFIEFSWNRGNRIHFVAHNDILKTYVKMFIDKATADIAKATAAIAKDTAAKAKTTEDIAKATAAIAKDTADIAKATAATTAFVNLFEVIQNTRKQNIWNIQLSATTEPQIDPTIQRIEPTTQRIEPTTAPQIDPPITITEVTIKEGIVKMEDSKTQTISACENLCTFDTLSNFKQVGSKLATRYSESLGNLAPHRIKKCEEQLTGTKKGWFYGGKKRTRRLAAKGKRHKSRRNYTKK